MSARKSIQGSDTQIAAFDGDLHDVTVGRFRGADAAHIANTPQRISRLVAERVTQARGEFPHES